MFLDPSRLRDWEVDSFVVELVALYQLRKGRAITADKPLDDPHLAIHLPKRWGNEPPTLESCRRVLVDLFFPSVKDQFVPEYAFRQMKETTDFWKGRCEELEKELSERKSA